MSKKSPAREAFTGAVFPRGWSQVPLDEVMSSFATNSVVLGDGAARVEVVPESTSSTSVPAGFVVPVVRGPVTDTWSEVMSWCSSLATSFEDAWLGNASAWFVDRDRRWVEPALFVDRLLHEVSLGDFDSRFFDHCRVRGVPFVVRLDGIEFSVIRVDDGSVVSSAPCGSFPVGSACALDGGDSVCSMHGGPWTSASMRAASAWSRHRARLVAALGCGVCAGTQYRLGAQVFEGDPIITPIEPSVPTRWIRAVSG